LSIYGVFVKKFHIGIALILSAQALAQAI